MTLDVALTHLCAYLDAHFEHEELLIERHHYPAAADHVDAHEKIRARAAALASGARAGHVSAGDVAEAIERRIHDHILTADLELAGFLRTATVAPAGDFQPASPSPAPFN